MNVRQYSVADFVPGGILPSDHAHRVTSDGTCSRCRREIGECEVPLMLWTRDGEIMWIFCDGCIAAGVPKEKLH